MIVVAFALGSVVVSSLLATKRPTAIKAAPYESGITPVDEPRGRLPIRFYVVAMLFIIFDVESVFLFPWAVIYKRLGLTELVEMAIFGAFLAGAFFYVWRRGGLEWE